MIKFDSDLNNFYSTKINDPSFIAGFSTKSLGDGSNLKNIEYFLKEKNIRYSSVVTLNQTHSDNISIFEISKNKNAHIKNTDGVVSKDDNVVLTVLTADCCPIIFVDKTSGAVGASHQGWRGTFNEMALKMIKAMIVAGANLSSITAVIGPTIGSCCYEIDSSLASKFKEKFNEFESEYCYKREEVDYLDISKLNYLQLKKAGLSNEQIDFFPFCTKCDSERFYSYRREGKQLSGEMFSFIVRIS